MIQFLQQYWRLILEGFFALFTLVFFILKKKPTTDIFSIIATQCVKAVLVAEESGVKGIEKLTIAVEYVNQVLLRQFPELDIEYYQKAIKAFIELILTTPQKKK